LVVDIYINGKLVGITDDGVKIVKKLRNLRRKGMLSPHINVALSLNKREVWINCDSGRIRRPLIIVRDGKPLLTKTDLEKLKLGEIKWRDLIRLGKIEFLDTDEEENAFIAIDESVLTEKHTHLEIDPIAILGAPASLVPYANFSRGDRVNYGASKGVKQALGLYLANYHLRMDTYSNILHYLQTPLTRTKTSDVLGFDSHPGGQNFIVAVIPHSGYNMEDALILNKGAIERGLGRSTFYRPYSTVEMRYPGGQEDIIQIPDKSTRGYRSEYVYRHLGDDGIADVESRVESDDILIGKTSPPRFLGSISKFKIGVEHRRETSVAVRHGEKGFVDFAIITEDQEGNKLVKVRVRDEKIPEIGDKFSSRHGQKGVIGLILPEEDMPFSESGLIPDLLANPHGIPSRMTVGHVLELLASKSACFRNTPVDGSAFSSDPVEELQQILFNNGFKRNGKEVLYDGITGEPFEVEIFIGVIYYHKLRHMVDNKLHARSRGPVQLLTRQPTEGRSKRGGLRMGEMEKDCLVAHGSSLLLKERFDSDATQIPICNKCGLVSIHDHTRDTLYCSVCGETSTVTLVQMSYAFHIMLMELLSVGIYPKLKLKDKG
jgi:DNA-directed RNA polymerase subunit B'